MRLFMWLLFIMLGLAAPVFAAEPPEQLAFRKGVFDTYWTWQRTESNELRRSYVPGERAREITHALAGATRFTDWELVVSRVGVDDFGHVWVTLIQCRETTPRYQISNATMTPDDELDQRLPLGSPMFDAIATLVAGDRVVASGEFILDDADGYRELGRVMRMPIAERMRFPNYSVKYTALRRLSTPKPDCR